MQTVLKCGHCAAEFVGTKSQVAHFKYAGVTSYCSGGCRAAMLKLKFGKEVPEHGPCPTCGSMFRSKTSKIYCSLSCYNKSAQFQEMLREHNSHVSDATRQKISESLKLGITRACLECSKEIYVKPSLSKRFCGRVCYRAYFAKRYDRWIASPEAIALPQCYDEFLDKEELPCLVAGCDWVGRHLANHANQAHGIKAEELKVAAGFNKSSGLVAKPLAQLLAARPKQGIAADGSMVYVGEMSSHAGTVVSLEAREHLRKVHALAGSGPERVCRGCGISFTQRKPFGRTVYCTKDCRSSYYKRTGKPCRC